MYCRYRGEDVARSITRNVIKEARAKELKAELLNNERLKVLAAISGTESLLCYCATCSLCRLLFFLLLTLLQIHLWSPA